MNLKEDIEYECGCKVIQSDKNYTSKSGYSLQLCIQHRELLE